MPAGCVSVGTGLILRASRASGRHVGSPAVWPTGRSLCESRHAGRGPEVWQGLRSAQVPGFRRHCRFPGTGIGMVGTRLTTGTGERYAGLTEPDIQCGSPSPEIDLCYSDLGLRQVLYLRKTANADARKPRSRMGLLSCAFRGLAPSVTMDKANRETTTSNPGFKCDALIGSGFRSASREPLGLTLHHRFFRDVPHGLCHADAEIGMGAVS